MKSVENYTQFVDKPKSISAASWPSGDDKQNGVVGEGFSCRDGGNNDVKKTEAKETTGLYSIQYFIARRLSHSGFVWCEPCNHKNIHALTLTPAIS